MISPSWGLPPRRRPWGESRLSPRIRRSTLAGNPDVATDPKPAQTLFGFRPSGRCLHRLRSSPAAPGPRSRASVPDALPAAAGVLAGGHGVNDCPRRRRPAAGRRPDPCRARWRHSSPRPPPPQRAEGWSWPPAVPPAWSYRNRSLHGAIHCTGSPLQGRQKSRRSNFTPLLERKTLALAVARLVNPISTSGRTTSRIARHRPSLPSRRGYEPRNET